MKTLRTILLGSAVLFILALSILSVQLSSCKKAVAQSSIIIHDTVKVHDTIKYCPQATYPVTGLWVGTYSEAGKTAQSFYSFIVYPDSTIVTRSRGFDGNYYYCSGKWSLSASNVFTATIVSFVTPGPKPVTQSISATFSASGFMTNGTWKDVINLNDTPLNGLFSTMQRVN